MRLASRLAAGPDAEDLVQATWVRALEHDAPVRERGSWLRRVLVNEQRMQIRAERRRHDRERALTQVADVPIDIEDVVHCLEVARVVGELVDALDEPVRLVVRERYFEGDSAAAIARRHRIPAGTVRWRLKSGLDRLREQLDAHYGGRRALWAGGFAPTLGAAPASPPASVGAAPAGIGASAMSTKIVLALGLVAASAGGAAWVAREAPPEDAPAIVVEEDAAPRETATAAASPVARDASTASAEKHRWARRLADIRTAHGTASPAPGAAVPTGAFTWHAAHDETPAAPHVGLCSDAGCMKRLAAQILGLVEGCKEFNKNAPRDLSLAAHVIGAPDVGTLVEYVTLSSSDRTPPDLEECLTESMYTLDLGPTEKNFEQTITVMIGEHEADDLDALGLDDETRARVEKALAAKGEGAKLQMVHLGEE